MIAVIVPSRGRPGNIAELIEAWYDTRRGYAELWVCVDLDDPELDGYRFIRDEETADWLHWIEGPRRRLGGTLNEVAPTLADRRHYTPMGQNLSTSAVGFMGDDHRPRTIGWDEQIDLALHEAAVVYGNDLLQGERLPTAVFMDSRIVRTLGHFVLPGQIHLWMDNYWKTLGEQLGTLRYLPDVIIEHVHPITGKVATDAGYEEANSAANWENDERIYKEWVAGQMPADIARVKAALL